MPWGRKITFLLLTVLCVLLFQNCSPNRFSTDDIGQMLAAIRTQDGQVFDGKLRILHNIVDGYTCEGRLAPESILIRETNNVWTWIQNTADRCAAAQQVVDGSLIQYDENSKTALYDGKTYRPPRPYNVKSSANPNTSDANLKDGVCEDSTGQCSLRAAVEQASVTSLTDAVLVHVPSGSYTLTAPLELSLPAEANAIKVLGQGAAMTVLDGGDSQPHFKIHSLTSSTVSIEKMSLIKGFDPSAAHGSSIQISADPNFVPGLKAPNSSVSISDCIFQNSRNGWAAIHAHPDSGSLQIHRSQMFEISGIGVRVDRSNGLLIEDSSFARINGRAILVSENQSAVVIRNSSFSENYEGLSLYNCSNCLLENVTVFRNSANGILLYSSTTATYNPNPNYNTIIRNSTLFNNATIPIAGQLRGNLSYGFENPAMHLTISNSILAMPANAASPNCMKSPHWLQNIKATNNIITDSTCNANDPSNISLDPMLAAEANNGGLGLTLMPLLGSPAIDNGSNALCLPQDQRRLPRPVAKTGAAICDIGAVEVQ